MCRWLIQFGDQVAVDDLVNATTRSGRTACCKNHLPLLLSRHEASASVNLYPSRLSDRSSAGAHLSATMLVVARVAGLLLANSRDALPEDRLGSLGSVENDLGDAGGRKPPLFELRSPWR